MRIYIMILIKEGLIKMPKKRIWIIIISVVLLLGLGLTTIFLKRNLTEFKLDRKSRYIVITDMKYMTMANDGGSHTNLYYEIDLDKKVVHIVTESYRANMGGTPESKKKVDTKKISPQLAEDLKELFTNLLAKEDIKDPSNYRFYTIKNMETTKNIYNTDSINSLKELLERIK